MRTCLMHIDWADAWRVGGGSPESPPQPAEAASSQTPSHSSPGLRLPPHQVLMGCRSRPWGPCLHHGITWPHSGGGRAPEVTTSCTTSGGSLINSVNLWPDFSIRHTGSQAIFMVIN